MNRTEHAFGQIVPMHKEFTPAVPTGGPVAGEIVRPRVRSDARSARRSVRSGKHWQPPEGLTPDDVRAVIAAASCERDRLLLRTLWATGGARLNSVAAHNPGFNPVGELGAPVIPASGTAITNPFEVDCTVYVNGGTLSQVAIGGSATGSLGGVYRVSAGQSITLTYSVVPTSWVWFGD